MFPCNIKLYKYNNSSISFILLYRRFVLTTLWLKCLSKWQHVLIRLSVLHSLQVGKPECPYEYNFAFVRNLHPLPSLLSSPEFTHFHLMIRVILPWPWVSGSVFYSLALEIDSAFPCCPVFYYHLPEKQTSPSEVTFPIIYLFIFNIICL